MNLQRIVAAALLAAGFWFAGTAPASAADAWPVRPVRVLVPFPPGGGTDLLARAIAEPLRASFGQPVVIDNRPGANGNVAAAAVARAAPDGYTLLVHATSIGTHSYIYPKLDFDPVKDLVAVGSLANSPLILVGRPDLPWPGLKELVAGARTRAGGVPLGVPGIGSPHHFAAELFGLRSGVRFAVIPYRGTGPMLTDLLGGQIELAYLGVASALPLMRSGKVKAYALASDRRSGLAPDLATFAELGVTGAAVSIRYGLLAPAATPPEVLSRISRDLGAALRGEAIRNFFARQGVEPMAGTAEEFRAMAAEENPRLIEAVHQAGIRAD